MSYSKKNLYKAIGIFSLVVIATLGVIWLVFLGLLQNLGDEYIANRRNLSEIEQKAQLRGELKSEFDEISAGAEMIEGVFLGRGDTLMFIEGLENLAASTQSGYEIQVAREIRDSATGDIIEIDFNISMDGDFNGLLQFLRGLREDLPYLTQITNITVERAQTGVLTTTATIKVFVE